MRGAAGTDEVRVIGIGKPICARPRLRDDSRLVEGERGGSGARKGEQVGDRLGAFRVRESVAGPLVDSQRNVFACRQLDEQLGTLALGGAYFEMRCTRSRDRARTEQGSAQIRRSAARPRKDALGRPVRRGKSARQDACLVKHLERPTFARDVQLIARSLLERAPPVRPDLGGNVEVAKERECAARGRGAREIEMHRDLPAAAEVETPGYVEERRKLRQAVTIAPRSDRCQLVANVLG
jgi:hypothetical protein